MRADQRTARARVAAVLRLALWRIRPAWRLLLVMQVGMIAALLVVCAVPLFSQVVLYTGLQGALEHNPSSHQLNAKVATNIPSSQLMRQVEEQVSTYVSTYLSSADVRLKGAPSVILNTAPFQFTQPSAKTNGATAQASGLHSSSNLSSTAPVTAGISAQPLSTLGGGNFGGISLFAYPHDQLTQQIHLIDGHLPQPAQNEIEILITKPTASKLHLYVGSSLTLAVRPEATTRPLVLRVAGIFSSATSTSYPNFDPYSFSSNADEVSYYAVTDSDSIVNSTYPWSSLALNGLPPSQDSNGTSPRWFISWIYELDVSRLTPDRASALLKAEPGNASYEISMPHSSQTATPTGGDTLGIDTELYAALRRFQQRILAAQIAVGVLLISVVGLMLLFVTQMSSLLIARQESLIALLRSRGASRRQIFATFATQGIAMALVALLVGPLLTVPLIRQVALALLPAQSQSVADALGGSPVTLVLGLWPMGLAVALVVALTMLLVVKRASALNILALRQEAARSNRKPLWRKLYLDVLAALLALVGYSMLALANSVTSSTPSSQNVSTLPILSPLGLVAPLFLMVAITLLFLRVFPLLLRLGERLAARGRGAPVQLALTQLARSARQSTQLIVLLALATGFALMTLSTLATADRYAADAANFDAGADFSGAPVKPSTDYTRLAGVQSAAKGYITVGSFVEPGQPPQDWSAPQGMIVSAVESERYAVTVAWPDVNGPGSVSNLLGLLRQEAPTADSADTVPAIVDGSAHVRAHAGIGTILTLWTPEVNARQVRFRVVAVVSHIPQMYASQPEVGGGMLVDYARYTQAIAAANGAKSVTPPDPNYVWLRTAGDSASLRSLRATLMSDPYQLTEIHTISMNFEVNLARHDRRSEIQEMHSDALYIDLTGTLTLGAAAALLLALIGTVVTLWIATRDRQVSFALLRALGSGPRRIRRQVIWEHGVVCAVGLALGGLLGALLTMAMAPTLPMLILTKGFGGPIDIGGIPVRVVWPAPALALTVGLLVAVCAGVVVLAARAAARPELAAVLRLNED